MLQEKWVSAETATGVRDCGYGCTMATGTGHATGTGTGAGVDINSLREVP